MSGWKQDGAALLMGAVGASIAMAGEPLLAGPALAATLALALMPRETLRPRLAPISARARRGRGA